jgi:hypothetical protein
MVVSHFRVGAETDGASRITTCNKAVGFLKKWRMFRCVVRLLTTVLITGCEFVVQ